MKRLILLVVMIVGCDGPRLSESIESGQKEPVPEFTFRTDLTVPHLEDYDGP